MSRLLSLTPTHLPEKFKRMTGFINPMHPYINKLTVDYLSIKNREVQLKLIIKEKGALLYDFRLLNNHELFNTAHNKDAREEEIRLGREQRPILRNHIVLKKEPHSLLKEICVLADMVNMPIYFVTGRDKACLYSGHGFIIDLIDRHLPEKVYMYRLAVPTNIYKGQSIPFTCIPPNSRDDDIAIGNWPLRQIPKTFNYRDLTNPLKAYLSLTQQEKLDIL